MGCARALKLISTVREAMSRRGNEHLRRDEMATRTWATARLLCSFGAVMAIAACGASKHDTASAAPASTASTSSMSAAGAAAIAAYEGMWTDMAKAGETANWRDPALGVHAASSALDVMVKILKEDDQMGAVLKGGPPVMHPRITSEAPTSNPTAIKLSDCLGSQHWLLYRKATGAPWNDNPGGNRAVTAEVVQNQGVWKVNSFTAADLGTC